MFTNPFRRGRGVDRWPKLARVIDKGGGQDGAHALGVGAQGQGDAKGDDNGVLALGCRGHSSSMSPGPVLVEARDLAGIVGRRLVVGHGRRAGVRRPDVVAAWNRRPGGFRCGSRSGSTSRSVESRRDARQSRPPRERGEGSGRRRQRR